MIHSVRLINCQSWENGIIPLAQDRINVLRADNNSGKSVFFKMLKITACPGYFTPKERKKLIRNGCDSANILYAFTDGSVGACSVYPTRVMYLYAEDGKNFEKYEEPPQEMITKLGIIHNADKFVANIIDMDQSMLLVDSNVHENYELIKLLTENESLNELKTKIQLNLEDFRVKESDLRFQSLELQNLLNNTEYKDVNKIKARIDRSKTLLEIMETLDQVDSLYNKIQDNWVEHLNYKELLKQLELLEVLANAITLAKSITFRDEVKKEQIETIDWAINFGSALTKFKPVQQVDYEEVGREIDSMTFLRDYLNALKSVKVVDKASLKKTAGEYNTMHALESLFSKVAKVKCVMDYSQTENQLKTMTVIKELHNSVSKLQQIEDFNGLSTMEQQVSTLEEMEGLMSTLTKIKHVSDVSDSKGKIEILGILTTLAQKTANRVKTQRTVEKIDQEIKKLQKEIEGKGTVIECPRFGKVLYNGQECFHGVLTDEVSGALAQNIPMQSNASQSIPTPTSTPQDIGREVKIE